MRGGERIERFLDLRGDPGLVETLGPVNLKAHHGPTIEHGNLRAFGNAVMHGRHLVQANLSPACQHDGQRIKFGCVPDGGDAAARSVARSVGKASVSTGQFRWSPYHYNKHNT